MKKRYLTATAIVLTGIMAAGTVTGCGAQKTQFKFITAMSDTDRAAIIDEVVADLQKKYPNVEFINDSGDDYNNKAKMAFSSGDGYQLVWTDDLGLTALRDAGYLMDITKYVQERGWVDKQVKGTTDFYNQRSNGVEYTVGYNYAPIVVFYNKDIFDELNLKVPTTVDEFENCLKTATEAGYIGAENCKDTINGWYIQSLVQNLAPWEDILKWYYLEDSPDSVKQAFIEAEETVKKWSDAGYFRDQYEGIDYGDVPSLFGQGQTAMSLDGNWFLYNYEQTDVNVGVFVFPGVKDASKTNVIINPVDAAFAVGADCNETQLNVALDFIDEMLTPEIEEKWLAIGSVPTLDYDFSSSAPSPLTADMLTAIEGTQSGFYLDNVKPGFLDVFQKSMQLMLSGDKSPEEMWSDLDEFWHENDTTEE